MLQQSAGATTHSDEWPRFERYRVLGRIGSGGCSTVYLCVPLEGGQPVAIKVPKRAWHARESCKKEWEKLRGLKAAHVVRVESSLATGISAAGDPIEGLVMEHIADARPIDAYCRIRSLSRGRRLRLLATVARALHAIHGYGVVHGDLKPQNVLVDRDGKPTIVDLGGAKCLLNPFDGPPIVTYRYSSPEQLEDEDGTTAIDTRSDHYSFGKLMAECLLGSDANDVQHVDAQGAASQLAALRSWTNASYRRHPQWRDDAVGQLLLELTDHDPIRRYEDMRSVARRLERLAWCPFAPRWATAVRAAVAAVLGILVGLAVTNVAVRMAGPSAVRFNARAVTAFDNVVICTIDGDEDLTRAFATAGTSEPTAVDSNMVGRVFAALIERFGRAGSRVAALDASIPEREDLTPTIDAVAKAIDSHAASQPVVTYMADTWRTIPTDEELAQALQPRVFASGSGYLSPPEGGMTLIPVAVQPRDHAPALHFATAAVAAALKGDISLHSHDWLFGTGELVVRPHADGSALSAPRRIPLDALQPYGAVRACMFDMKSSTSDDSAVAVLALDVRTLREAGDAVRVSASDALSMSIDSLRQLVRGKIVLICNVGANGKRDAVSIGDGRSDLPTVYLHAAAIEALLLAPPVHWLRRAPATALLTAGVAGLAVAGWSLALLRRGRPAASLLVLVSAVAAAATAVLAMSSGSAAPAGGNPPLTVDYFVVWLAASFVATIALVHAHHRLGMRSIST